MTTDRRMIDKYYMVSDLAIVSDMRAGHRKAIVADSRNHSAVARARIHRDMFTNTTARAHDEL